MNTGLLTILEGKLHPGVLQAFENHAFRNVETFYFLWIFVGFVQIFSEQLITSSRSSVMVIDPVGEVGFSFSTGFRTGLIKMDTSAWGSFLLKLKTMKV